MNKDSVLGLKQKVLQSLVKESNTYATSTQSLAHPRLEGRLAVGLSQKGEGDYQLELRVQSASGKAYRRAEEIKEEASQDVNIEVVPMIEIPPKKAVFEAAKDKSKMGQSKRPLHIGLSVGHSDGTAGTLGAFVSDEDDNECILSNNHVLALMGQAKLKDPIFQPGRPDQSPLTAKLTIAELSDFVVISKSERNPVDSAVAILAQGINHDSNIIPKGFGFPSEGKAINKPPKKADELLEILKKDETVCKIGRTTGFTEGQISAFGLDYVPVKTSIGIVLFDNVIEVTWESDNAPFSQPGDSGSLLFIKKGLVAAGLHFAGGEKLVNGRRVGVSYSCNIVTVLETHKVSYLD